MSKDDFLRQPSRRNRVRAFRRRHNQFELLEQRHMLSAAAWSGETEEIPGDLPDFITTADRIAMSTELTEELAAITVEAVGRAFDAASDLGLYTVEEMTTAASWIVRTYETISESAIASQLDTTSAEAFLPIENTYIVSSNVATGEVGLNDWLMKLDNNSNIRNFYPSLPVEYQLNSFPNDPYFEYQWHLVSTGQDIGNPDHLPVYSEWGNDINVFPVWDSYTGAGIQIAILDTGIQYTHPDLQANYNTELDYDYVGLDSDPRPGDMLGELHSTAVAGVAAGVGNNDIGIAGVAYDAEIIGVRILSSFGSALFEDMYDALRHEGNIIDVYNSSWGSSQLGGVVANNPGAPFTIQAISDSHFFGRNGLGSIHVFSAGNDGAGGGSCDWTYEQNDRYTISVGAVSEEGFQTNYSSYGSSLLTSAYSGSADGLSAIPIYGSGIWTADLAGDDYGYNMADIDEDPLGTDPFMRDYFPDTDYTSRFSGTSSAAPVVSGVIALMLEANPNLTYRDVEHILVRSSAMTGFNQYVGQPDNIIFEFEPWFYTNSAGNTFSYGLGHGIIDAQLAVALAENWTPVTNEIHHNDPDTIHGNSFWIFPGPSGAIAACNDNFCPMNLGSTDEDPGEPFITDEMPDDMVVEWLEVSVEFDEPPEASALFEIDVHSPDGTVDRLTSGGAWVPADADTLEWTFKTNNFWGERLGGEWMFDFLNFSTEEAHLLRLRLDWYGTEAEGTARVQGDIALDLNGNGAVDTEANPFGDQIPIEPQAPEMIVYVDLNENEVRDASEPFFMTGNDGNWYFDLDAGNYVVRVEVPDTMQVTDGMDVINVTLNDGDRTKIDTLLLDPDPIMISGNVFIDNDGNGYNNGEPPATNFTVFADTDLNGELSAGDVVTTTDGSGNYTLFVDEGTGVYTIFVVGQNHLEVTNPAVGFHMLYLDAGDIISNITFAMGVSGTVVDPDPTGAIVTGYVFNDTDGDGNRDTGESGLSSWIVFLDINEDGLIGIGEPASRTAADGSYTFTNLVPEFYRVRVVAQPGWEQTAPGGDGSYLLQTFPQQTLANINFGFENLLADDYGDLPAPYPTLASENGPSHPIQSFFYLGASIDGEADGQPNANALGDDLTGIADEDGIVVLDPISGNTAVRIEATANVAGGYLQGWMDYNRDGDWDDDGERILTNVLLDPGANILTIDIPGHVMAGPMYSRFRYGEYGIDSYMGPALGGEVEDYVFNAVKATPLNFVDPDFNEDQQIDGTDLTLWETGFGTDTGAAHSDGDADGDGDVDGNDFLLWQLGLGSSGSAAANTTGGTTGKAAVSVNTDTPVLPATGLAGDLATVGLSDTPSSGPNGPIALAENDLPVLVKQDIGKDSDDNTQPAQRIAVIESSSTTVSKPAPVQAASQAVTVSATDPLSTRSFTTNDMGRRVYPHRDIVVAPIDSSAKDRQLTGDDAIRFDLALDTLAAISPTELGTQADLTQPVANDDWIHELDPSAFVGNAHDMAFGDGLTGRFQGLIPDRGGAFEFSEVDPLPSDLDSALETLVFDKELVLHA